MVAGGDRTWARMEREEILSRLVRLGLERDEAQAYVQLYIMGPCRAGDLAGEMNVHQTKGYWAMNHLTKKGFAVALPSQPKRYEAREPGEIAERMLQTKRDRIDEIRRLWRDIEDPLHELREENRDAVPDQTYRMIHGRKDVVREVQAAFDRTESEMLVFSVNPWAYLTPESYAPLWEKGLARAEAGVDVRGVFHTSEEMWDDLAAALEIPTVAFRHMEPERRRPFVVLDGEEIFYWLVTDPSTEPQAEREVVVWSNAPDLVDEHYEMFATFWEQAAPIDASMAVEGTTVERDR